MGVTRRIMRIADHVVEVVRRYQFNDAPERWQIGSAMSTTLREDVAQSFDDGACIQIHLLVCYID